MERIHKVLIVLVVVLALVLAGLVGGFIWYRANHVTVQEEHVPKYITSITLTSLTRSDITALDQMPTLEEINAQGVRDYELLTELKYRRPGCRVHYTVALDGQEYPEDTTEITLNTLAEQELPLFQYLPQLEKIHAESCTEYALLQQLRDMYPQLEVSYTLPICGGAYETDTTKLKLEAPTDDDLALLAFLPGLESVHIVDPAATPELFLETVVSYPDVEFSWETEIAGVHVDNTTTELSFLDIPMTGTEEVSEGLAYFPSVTFVDMSNCGIDNEVMAAFREEKREDYKVVWTVQCGPLAVRTDEVYFIPVKHNVFYFHDDEAYNLRYCEDMVSMDLGHMSLHTLEFVEFMPHLKYLVLAHTTILDITSLSKCKELVFLEIDFTGISDYTPLLECTALEDLNLGHTYGDREVIAQMTWLKNLWWIGAGHKTRLLLEEKLPDTHLQFLGKRTVDGGWRQLQNYFDHRDIMGMEYMP